LELHLRPVVDLLEVRLEIGPVSLARRDAEERRTTGLDKLFTIGIEKVA
jgi:hypothetical protein